VRSRAVPGGTRVLFLTLTRHFRAWLSHVAATRLDLGGFGPPLFSTFALHAHADGDPYITLSRASD